MSGAFPAGLGARLRRSVGCPEGARQTRVSNRCSSIAWAAGPPQRCTPVQQALILPILRFYGSASAEPFLFVRCFSCWTGGTTAQVCRLPRRGETDARFKSLLKHRVGGGAAPAMHPSSASADFTDTAILRLCFGRAVFVCQTLFLLDWGGTTAQAGKSKLFSRWLDIFAVWHIMKVVKGS